ncbi:MAG: RluA family pseudouridine synthase [Bacilli bacterium]
MKLKYEITEDISVKEYLKNAGLSRNLLKKVKGLDNIYVNGESQKNYYCLKKGDILELEFKEQVRSDIEEWEKPLDIVYEDQYLLIVNKENNISMQPSRKHKIDNMISALKYYLKVHNIQGNIHLVNRLDYPTSGLFIVALNGIIHYQLAKEHIVKKYICEIEGKMDNKEGTIDKGIARYAAPSIIRYVSSEGKQAITKYVVKTEKENSSLLEMELLTGRCHQIRVHMAYLGHPILGDNIYGTASDGILHLHAYYLKFVHPVSGEIIEIKNYRTW